MQCASILLFQNLLIDPFFLPTFFGTEKQTLPTTCFSDECYFTVCISHHVGILFFWASGFVLLIALVDACSDWLGWWQMGVWKALQGFPTKSAAIKLAMKGKKWAIKAVILGRSLTGDRLAECAWVSLTYLDVDRNCRPNVIAQENSTLLWVGMKMLTTGVIMLRW